MNAFFIFANSLAEYLKNENPTNENYLLFYETIKDIECNDFRLYFHKAAYLLKINDYEMAKLNIDKAMNLLQSLKPFGIYNCNHLENNSHFMVPMKTGGAYRIKNYPTIKSEIGDVFSYAGEIYSILNDEISALNFYKKSLYYKSFLMSEFDALNRISVFSFRRFNEYSLSDLINNMITVSPSIKMNDPFDSIMNLWGNENRLMDQCQEKKHIRPMCESFKSYRIRSFCLGKGNIPIKNILMWSHYAGEHTGFCIKYKLSKHFMCQEENDNNEHMYLKKIIYTNKKVDILTSDIDSNLAFATKKKDWKYENEVRLIVYNPNKKDPFYGVKLDDNSEIESIFFGYRCSDATINTIKNVFLKRATKSPKFYKMILDNNDIYNLKYSRI